MKKVLLVLAGVLLSNQLVFGGEGVPEVKACKIGKGDTYVTNNTYVSVEDKDKTPVGAGVDVIVYKPKTSHDLFVANLEAVEVQMREDWQNGGQSYYLVGKLDASEKITKAWSSLMSLFKKGE